MVSPMVKDNSIIAHLRAGSSSKMNQPSVSPPNGASVSAYIRRRHSLSHPAPAPSLALSQGLPYKHHGMATTPFLPSRPSTTTTHTWTEPIFLLELRKMLRDVEITGEKLIVSWAPRGLTFVVRDQLTFASKIAPRYFNLFSYSTFCRITDAWGFTIEKDGEHDIFFHPKFQRDDPLIHTTTTTMTMQKMKQIAVNASNSGGAKLEDALLLLSTSKGSSSDRSKSPKPGERQSKSVPKKGVRRKKSGDLKKVVVKGYLDRMAGGGNTDVRAPMMAAASQLPSSAIQMLKAQRRHSIHSITATSNPMTPMIESTTAAKKLVNHKAKTGMSSDLSFLMYKGAVISTNERNPMDNLHEMLACAEQEGFFSIVSWIMPHGKAFRIYNEKEFVKKILPRFTNKTSFSSFEKGLERYGFVKFKVGGSNKGAYFHPLFVRHQAFLTKGKTSIEMQALRWKGTQPPYFLSS